MLLLHLQENNNRRNITDRWIIRSARNICVNLNKVYETYSLSWSRRYRETSSPLKTDDQPKRRRNFAQLWRVLAVTLLVFHLQTFALLLCRKSMTWSKIRWLVSFFHKKVYYHCRLSIMHNAWWIDLRD